MVSRLYSLCLIILALSFILSYRIRLLGFPEKLGELRGRPEISKNKTRLNILWLKILLFG